MVEGPPRRVNVCWLVGLGCLVIDQPTKQITPKTDERLFLARNLALLFGYALAVLELRPYQQEAVTFLQSRSRAIEGDAPGVGKTATVITSLASREPAPSPVLVLCPLSVVRHWEAEIGRWTAYQPIVGIGSAGQRRQARESIIEASEAQVVYVTNYEAAKSDIADLAGISWQAMICDEAHRLKNRKTKTFKVTRQLALPTSIFVAITGTPILNRVDELWSLLHLVDPKRWKSYWAYVDAFCDSKTTTFNGKLAIPVRVVEGLRPGMDGVLRQQLRDVMIRRSLDELLPELPEINETIYEVDLSGAERKAYDQMADRYFSDLPDGSKLIAPNDVAKITRLRQLSNNWSVLGATDESSTKIKRLMELLDDIGDEQVVIFSAFAKVIDPIAAALKAGKITGDVAPNDRADVIKAFRSGYLRHVCGTIGAMGEGIDLQTARHVVFCDLDWTPARNEQCIARVHRYGQRADAVFVHVIAARNTIDSYIAKTLADKQAIIDSLVGMSWHGVTQGAAHGA